MKIKNGEAFALYYQLCTNFYKKRVFVFLVFLSLSCFFHFLYGVLMYNGVSADRVLVQLTEKKLKMRMPPKAG